MTLVRKIYLYLFSLIGLVLVVIGCVQLVNLGLKAFIFTGADQYYAYPTAPMAAGTEPSSAVPASPTNAELQAYQDEQTKSQRESTAADALAMIIVGVPLYLYHWYMIKKDKEAT
jgi:hypothetical protein